MGEVVWQGGVTGGAWLTRRGCPADAPDKWELGVTGEYTRMAAGQLASLRDAIDVQLALAARRGIAVHHACLVHVEDPVTTAACPFCKDPFQVGDDVVLMPIA